MTKVSLLSLLSRKYLAVRFDICKISQKITLINCEMIQKLVRLSTYKEKCYSQLENLWWVHYLVIDSFDVSSFMTFMMHIAGSLACQSLNKSPSLQVNT